MSRSAPQLIPVTNRPIISNSGDEANWQTAHSTAPMYAGMQLIRTAFFLKMTTNPHTHIIIITTTVWFSVA